MRGFHRNWGTCRKPEGERGRNFATSRGQGRGGEVKGRARKGLGCGCPRLAFLSLARSGHRHEGPPAEMIVLLPAWNPTVRILGGQGRGKAGHCHDGQSREGRCREVGRWTGVGAVGRGGGRQVGGDDLKLRESDRSGGDGQRWEEMTGIEGRNREVGTNGGAGTPMGEMSTEGQRGRQRRFQAEVRKDRSMGQVGRWGQRETWGKGDWMALDRSREKNRDRGSEVSSRKQIEKGAESRRNGLSLGKGERGKKEGGSLDEGCVEPIEGSPPPDLPAAVAAAQPLPPWDARLLLPPQPHLLHLP